MRKIIYAILALSIVFTTTGCGIEVSKPNENKATETKHLYVASIKNGYSVPVESYTIHDGLITFIVTDENIIKQEEDFCIGETGKSNANRLEITTILTNVNLYIFERGDE